MCKIHDTLKIASTWPRRFGPGITRLVRISAVVFLCSCSDKPDANVVAPAESADAAVSDSVQPRTETRAIKALEVLGHDSKPIRKSADKAINATEAQDKKWLEVLEQAEQNE